MESVRTSLSRIADLDWWKRSNAYLPRPTKSVVALALVSLAAGIAWALKGRRSHQYKAPASIQKYKAPAPVAIRFRLPYLIDKLSPLQRLFGNWTSEIPAYSRKEIPDVSRMTHHVMSGRLPGGELFIAIKVTCAGAYKCILLTQRNDGCWQLSRANASQSIQSICFSEEHSGVFTDEKGAVLPDQDSKNIFVKLSELLRQSPITGADGNEWALSRSRPDCPLSVASENTIASLFSDRRFSAVQAKDLEELPDSADGFSDLPGLIAGRVGVQCLAYGKKEKSRYERPYIAIQVFGRLAERNCIDPHEDRVVRRVIFLNQHADGRLSQRIPCPETPIVERTKGGKEVVTEPIFFPKSPVSMRAPHFDLLKRLLAGEEVELKGNTWRLPDGRASLARSKK